MRCRARPGRFFPGLILTAALPCALSAQVEHRFSLSGGAWHASLVDPVSSALRYSGAGPTVSVSYAREGATLLQVRGDLGRPRLGSTLTGTGDLPRERATMAALELRLLRPGRDLLGGRIRAGLTAHGDLLVRDHWYSQPPVVTSFVLAVGSLGPAVGWTRHVGRGELRADAALPLVGIVYRPYSDIESVKGDPVHLRFAALDRLQEPALGVAWALPVGRRARALAAWRFEYLRYRGDTVFRQARQTLSAGLEIPLGGRR